MILIFEKSFQKKLVYIYIYEQINWDRKIYLVHKNISEICFL